MARPKALYACQSCGAQAPKWSGQCPECEAWNTLTEIAAPEASPGSGRRWSGGTGVATVQDANEVSAAAEAFTASGIGELDRVLGGGLVPGAVILIVALGFRALPRSAFVLPYFFAANRLGILDSRLVLVLALVAVNQPFTIWMLRSFFMDVPKSLEEAAIMDGATRFGAFRRVIVPIMWPGIIATALFTLLLAYNEFLFVRVLAVTNFTLPVGIEAALAAEGPQLFNEIPAASVSITLPIIIVIILFQKHLVKGLGAGAVKG